MIEKFTRKTKLKTLKAFGQELTYNQWSRQKKQKELGLTSSLIMNRVIQLKWTPEKALTTCVKSQAPVFSKRNV